MNASDEWVEHYTTLLKSKLRGIPTDKGEAYWLRFAALAASDLTKHLAGALKQAGGKNENFRYNPDIIN